MAIAFVSVSQLFLGESKFDRQSLPSYVLLGNRKKPTLIFMVIVFLSVSAV